MARFHAAVDAWRVPLCWPVEPDPPGSDAAAGDPVWCRRCARLIRAALAELDDLASMLQAVSDGHRGAGARHGKTGPAVKGSSAPSPGQDIPNTLDELFGALVRVEDDWREFRGYSGRPARPRNGHARRLSIGWLLDELDAILTHPGSVQFGRATLAWQRRLRTLTKSDPVGTLSPVRCTRCGEVNVRREDDGYHVCRTCGRLMSEAEHDRAFDEQAAAQEAAELAEETPVRGAAR
jgi:hypothetical protein